MVLYKEDTHAREYLMSKKRVVAQKIHKEEVDYEKQIRKLEKEVRRLKTENKTLQDALSKTDDYLIDMVKDRTIEEIMQNIRETTDVVVQEKCPNCGTDEMKKINLGTIKIIACSRCSYRNRLNEPGSSQT
jgi:predicted nuclease with TOPRIM domain